jgi:hypothetical protein
MRYLIPFADWMASRAAGFRRDIVVVSEMYPTDISAINLSWSSSRRPFLSSSYRPFLECLLSCFPFLQTRSRQSNKPVELDGDLARARQ